MQQIKKEKKKLSHSKSIFIYLFNYYHLEHAYVAFYFFKCNKRIKSTFTVVLSNNRMPKTMVINLTIIFLQGFYLSLKYAKICINHTEN